VVTAVVVTVEVVVVIDVVEVIVDLVGAEELLGVVVVELVDTGTSPGVDFNIRDKYTVSFEQSSLDIWHTALFRVILQ
jgi:hypothetical protein